MDHDALLVINLTRTEAFPARLLALSLGVQDVQMVSAVGEALRMLAERREPPRYIVLNLDNADGPSVLETVTYLMRAVPPGARVIATGAVNDVNIYRELKALGVYEYFTQPLDMERLAQAFQHSALPRIGGADINRQGKVITFFSAASGDGASTAALNVAYALAAEYREPTVLVDMDYQFGMIARQLDLSAPFGIRELFEYPERGVDAALLEGMLLPYTDTLSLIAAPADLRFLPSIRPETVHELIGVLRQQFAFVVIDLPHVWMPWTAEALLQADRVVAVSQLWLRSLTHLSRLMGLWGEMGMEKENILLAINRAGAKLRESLSAQDFERVILRPVNFYLANDTKAIAAADAQGKTVVELGNSPLERQYRDMARVLYNLRGGKEQWQEPPPMVKKARRFLLASA